MTQTEETRKVMMHFLRLLGERSPTITKLFYESVDWHIPGNEKLAPWLGIRKTNAEIGDFFKLLWKNTEPVSAQIDYLLVEGDVAIATGSFVTKMLKTGRTVTSLFSIQVCVEHGLIARYRLLEDSYAVSQALSP